VPFDGRTDALVYIDVLFGRRTPERPQELTLLGEHKANALWELMVCSWGSDPTTRLDSAGIRDHVSSKPLRQTSIY
jgi:hypothetical protein